MNPASIIKVTDEYVGQLRQISISTFTETFASFNTEANMKNYLESAFSVQKIAEELKNPDSLFYFACIVEDIIGYLKINIGRSQTDIKQDKGIEIERIYVKKQFHGKQIGDLLLDKALNIARDMNADYIWLGVWEDNPRAIRFYEKKGFVAFDKHIFKLGDDEQTDIMMRLDLKNQ